MSIIFRGISPLTGSSWWGRPINTREVLDFICLYAALQHRHWLKPAGSAKWLHFHLTNTEGCFWTTLPLSPILPLLFYLPHWNLTQTKYLILEPCFYFSFLSYQLVRTRKITFYFTCFAICNQTWKFGKSSLLLHFLTYQDFSIPWRLFAYS